MVIFSPRKRGKVNVVVTQRTQCPKSVRSCGGNTRLNDGPGGPLFKGMWNPDAWWLE